nr:hypothetical protein [Candidatus Sigynarchaeota archaeon]
METSDCSLGVLVVSFILYAFVIIFFFLGIGIGFPIEGALISGGFMLIISWSACAAKKY